MKRLVLTAIAALALSAAPAASTGGNLLCHISFDDESKPFKAEVGKDAFVRLGKNERVEGLNKTKWTNGSTRWTRAASRAARSRTTKDA